MNVKIKESPESIPKREIVYKRLRRQIYSGYLLPGSRLIELDLAEQFGVSRTIIREVIKQLAVEGLVELVPYKGATVAKMSVKDLEEIYRIQQDLEGLAAYLATRRLTEEQIRQLERIHRSSMEVADGDVVSWQQWNTRFHRIFLDHCGNRRLRKLVENHSDYFARYWFLLLSSPGVIERNIQVHQRIIDAVKKRKPLLVRYLMEKHLGEGVDRLLEIIRKTYPSIFLEVEEIG